MSDVIEISGAVVKLEPNQNGFYTMNLKGDDGAWHNNISLGIKQAPQSFGKGDRVKVQYFLKNGKFPNLVEGTKPEVLPKESNGGGYQKQGGYQNKSGGGKQGFAGGKKPFVDNSVGMGIGAALNNATQLFIGGKIKESEIPVAMANLYELSEAMKKAATEDTLQATASEYSFSLSGSAEKKPAAKKAPAKAAAKKAPEPEPEGDEEDFDDD